MSALAPPSTKDMEKQAVLVLSDMLKDRGYTLQYVDKDCTKQETYCIKANKTGTNDWVICFINDEEKVNIASIKERIAIMNKEPETYTRSIIVYRSSVTSTAKKSIETLEYNFELFGLNELQVNITQHRLVPPHHRVTEEERKMLEEKFKGKLPQILTTDPVARYYNFQRGEYIRIHRKEGRDIAYRVVK